jgi:hypothetical protein
LKGISGSSPSSKRKEQGKIRTEREGERKIASGCYGNKKKTEKPRKGKKKKEKKRK